MPETFDTVETNAGSGGAKVAGDTFTQAATSIFVPGGYLVYGAAGGPYERVDTATGLPVQPQTSSTWIVVGAAAHDAAASGNPVLLAGYASASAPTSVTDGDACRIWVTAAGAVNVADGGGSLTIDNATLSVTGGGVEASALRVTIASDSTGVLSVDDNGGSLTVDGTVAATQSGTWNVGTVTTVSAVTAITNTVAVGGVAAHDAAVSGNPVLLGAEYDDAATDGVDEGDVGRLRISSNRNLYVTLRDAAGNERGLNVDGSGNLTVNVTGTVTVGSHAVTNAGTFAVQESGAALTALQLIDNLVLAEDAAHNSGDPGVQVLAVRKDAGAALAGTDGDYSPLQVDSSGNLRVNVAAGGGSGGTSSTDDAAFTAASGSGTPMMGFVTSDSVDSGDVGVVGMLANRQLKVTLYDSSGVELAVGGGTQYTEDAAAAANPTGTVPMLVRKDTPASEVSADGDNIAQRGSAYGAAYVTLLDTGGSPVSVGGGTQYTEDAAAAGNPTGNALILVRADSLGALTSADGDNVAARGTDKGELYVKHVDSIPVTDNGGSLTVDGTVAVSSLPASTNTLEVVGDAAHDAAAAGNPVLLGAYAKTTAPTDVSADGDVVRLWADLAGRLQVGDGGATLSVDDGGGSLTVDGTVAVSSLPASTNTLEVVGDAAHDAAAAGNPVLLGAYASAAAPTDVSADGDAVRVWALRNGSAVCNLAVGGTLVTGSAGLPVAQQGTWTVGLSAGTNTNEVVGDAAHDAAAAGNPLLMGAYASAAAPTDVSADADAVRLWALRSGALATQPTYAGVLAVAGNGASGTGVQRVTIANDSTGVLATVSTVTTVTTVSTLTGGGVAHDGADSGNPVKVGAKASATLSDDTMVADGDRTNAVSDLDGALITRPQFPLGDIVTERVSNTDGASTAFTNFAAVASTRNVITAIVIANTSSTNGYVDFRDGTAGSVLYTVPIPANGGVVLPAGATPYFRTSANTALAFDVSGALTTVYISVTGFKSKV